MLSFTSKPILTLLTILMISTDITVLAQPPRNITIPPTSATTTPTTSTTTSSTQTSPSTTLANNTTTTPTGNNTASGNVTTPIANNSTKTSTNTTAVKLTPIPDATGTAGNVPVPASTGKNPKGRYGPDDQYIAGLPKLAAPLLSALLVMSSTAVVLSLGPIF